MSPNRLAGLLKVGFTDAGNYYFFSQRTRTAAGASSYTGNKSGITRIYLGQALFAAHTFRFGLPGHFNNTLGLTPTEIPLTTDVYIDGVDLGYGTSIDPTAATWITGTVSGSAGANIPTTNTVGLVTDDIGTPSQMTTAGRTLAIGDHVWAQVRYTGAGTGTTQIPQSYQFATGVAYEGNARAASAYTSGNRAMAITGANTVPGYGPEWVVCKGHAGRAVFLITGDSISWGDSEDKSPNLWTYGVFGHTCRGMYSATKRSQCANICVPGSSPNMFATSGRTLPEVGLVTGTLGTGNVLTATLGTGWTTTGYQWQRDYVALGGETASTYTQVAGDVGHTLTCKLTSISYNAVSFSSAITQGVTIGIGTASAAYTGTLGRKWDLIKLLPNVPFTHILSQAGTNALGSTDAVPGAGLNWNTAAGFLAGMKYYADQYRSEWTALFTGPILQTTIPWKGATTDAYTTTGGQTVNSNYGGPTSVSITGGSGFNAQLTGSNASGKFDGYMDTAATVAYVGDDTKVKMITYSGTLTNAYTVAATSAVITSATAPTLGAGLAMDPGGAGATSGSANNAPGIIDSVTNNGDGTFTVTLANPKTYGGTAQAGSTASTIKIASSDGAPTDGYVSYTVNITGGTGSGQSATVTAYNATTKVATISGTWTTTPDNTSVYNFTVPAGKSVSLIYIRDGTHYLNAGQVLLATAVSAAVDVINAAVA